MASDRTRKVTIYLSGGGYRAALGSLGVLFFLAQENLWSNVAKIISVSGGSIVNARLALRQPNANNIAEEIEDLFRRLTSRRGWHLFVSVVVLPSVVLLVIVFCVTKTLLPAPLNWIATIAALALLVWLILRGLSRVWLYCLYRSMVGTTRLGDLREGNWNVEHTFVATDLSNSGSFFMSYNRVQPMMFSLKCGFMDGRELSFIQVIRASTALPPALPPLFLRFRQKPSRKTDLGFRTEWLNDRASNCPSSIWLIDGGVTGNLGIQLDSKLAPDNRDLLDQANSKVQRGLTPEDSYCAHGEISWMCGTCEPMILVVDSSGVPPQLFRWMSLVLHIPGIGVLYHAIRSMSVMYESALLDDQAIAGKKLVSVARTDQLLEEYLGIRYKIPSEVPLDSRSNMHEAGRRTGIRQSFGEYETVRKLLGTPLLLACWAAREQAAQVKTFLFPIKPKIAARIVASGFLNACLTVHGNGAIEIADQGIRELSKLLGDHAELVSWWESIQMRKA